ncbi:hypothetical protein [Acetobacter persici]|nr:hypothetical protein [Acetobacter persici]MBS0961926.1 hypothetical protein [Acetobacter persici]
MFTLLPFLQYRPSTTPHHAHHASSHTTPQTFDTPAPLSPTSYSRKTG